MGVTAREERTRKQRSAASQKDVNKAAYVEEDVGASPVVVVFSPHSSTSALLQHGQVRKI